MWTLLVVQSGSDDVGHGPGNDAPIINPIVGQAYSHSTGKSSSHVILCMEPKDDHPSPGQRPSPSPGSTTTTAVGQAGPTSRIAQSYGGSTTVPVGSTLPATGVGDL